MRAIVQKKKRRMKYMFQTRIYRAVNFQFRIYYVVPEIVSSSSTGSSLSCSIPTEMAAAILQRLEDLTNKEVVLSITFNKAFNFSKHVFPDLHKFWARMNLFIFEFTVFAVLLLVVVVVVIIFTLIFKQSFVFSTAGWQYYTQWTKRWENWWRFSWIFFFTLDPIRMKILIFERILILAALFSVF